MAPLPMFHRPLSLDNSRETSLSSGRGGVLSGPDTSNESGGGISLPLSGAGGSTGGGGSHKRPSMSTLGTPSTANTLAGANSSDYLVPLAGAVSGSNGSISTAISQDPQLKTGGVPYGGSGPKNNSSAMAVKQKPLNGQSMQQQKPYNNRDHQVRRKSSGHHSSGPGYPATGPPSTPSDNEADADVVQQGKSSRRQSRTSNYAVQKSGSRDNLRYNNNTNI